MHRAFEDIWKYRNDLEPAFGTRHMPADADANDWLLRRSEFLAEIFRCTSGPKDMSGKPMSDYWLIPGYYLLNLSEIKAEGSLLAKSKWIPFMKRPKSGSLIPFLANGAGDYHAIHISRSGKETVFEIPHDFEATCYGTPENYLSYLGDCFEDQAFFIDSEGWIDSDPDKESGIEDKYLQTL